MTHFITIAFRNLARKPVYSIITFTGFTIGITASLIIYLWVFNELSYEKFHSDYQRIYRVLTLSKQGEETVKSPGCYRPVAKTMKMDYPQIEYATYISTNSEDSPLQKESGGEKIEARMSWSDDDFFRIFNGFTFIEGSPKKALKNPDNIILSEKVAKKLFGNQSALGQIVISDKYSKEVYTVAGVVHVPEQSHLDFGCIVSEKNSRLAGFTDSWTDNSNRVYIKLKKGARIDSEFLNSITNQISKYSKSTDKLMFQPIADIHLHSDYENYFYDKNQGSYKYVWIFSGLALLIVLMASLNFSVLSIARASERATEIGVKKVNGAGRSGIFRQFMAESVFQTFLATIIALLIIWIILPWFNELSGKELVLRISVRFATTLFFLTFMVGVIAGIYPSFYLSSLNPIGIFRGGSTTGSKINFIRVLVTAQFSIAIFFIIATFMFVKQLNYIHNKDLGIDDKNVVVVPTGLWYDNKLFKEELLKNPGIISVSASTYAPVDYALRYGIPLNFKGRTDTLQVGILFVDEDFAKTYKLEIAKGRFLQMNYRDYWKEGENNGKKRKEGKEYTVSIPIVINETAEKILRFDDPIGQRLGDNVIVGVVKDFHFRPLRYPIGPLVMTNNPENIMTMNVRIAPENKSGTIKFIHDTFMKYRDKREFSYDFFDDLLNLKYEAEIHLRNITTAFAFLAIVISIMGILGMAIFSIDRRTKEIGIRKVTGAETSEILVLLNKDFVKWVGVAFLIATPIAVIVLYKWLQNFAYKTELSWWILVMAGFLAVLIAVITVSLQSWRAATRNPIESLRYE